MAAFSIKATNAGVANTSISPEPSAKAVLVEFTCTVLLYVSPVSIVFYFEVINSFFSLGFGGSYEPRPERMGDVAVSDKNVYETMIKVPGEYRLYVYVLDNTGFVSTANIPFQVID
jgi:hypothetical protein